MLKEELRAHIHGTVHGVGFRASAKRCADQLQLSGYVRNVPNGTVEICAQGERKTLERFLKMLQQEFSTYYIRHIDSAFHAIETPYHDFKIIR
jgi:acylphosphatase